MHFRDVRVASRGVDQGVAPQGHPVDRLGGGAEKVLQKGPGAGVGVRGEEELAAVLGAAPTHALEAVSAVGDVGGHLGNRYTG